MITGTLILYSLFIHLIRHNYSLAGFLKSCGGFAPDVYTRPRDKNCKPVLHQDIQKIIFEQIVDAVLLLHDNGIAHKDLKDENILIDADLRVRLIDFGHASFYRATRRDQYIAPFRAYGTPIFSPPEVRSGLAFIGPEADVYALGLILFEMTFGDLPVNYDCARYSKGGECIFDISQRTGFHSADLRDLLRWMLCPDPRNRATLEEVKSHPWLCSY